MKSVEICVMAILGVGLFSPALAGDGMDHPTPPSFSDIDVNDDALISHDELRSMIESMHAKRGERQKQGHGQFNPFDRADADGDGYLNQEEFEAMRSAMENRRNKHLGHGEYNHKDDEA